MKKLLPQQISRSLSELSGWCYENGAIHKSFAFASYMDGIEFVNQLAVKAEEFNHHPDLMVGWCRVGVSFTTHDSGGVTKNDIAMATAVESLQDS